MALLKNREFLTAIFFLLVLQHILVATWQIFRDWGALIKESKYFP